jgi:hypothetical protein
MSIKDENIKYTHNVYSVDCLEKLTLTKIGEASISKYGEYMFNVNIDCSEGDLLIYRKVGNDNLKGASSNE